MNINRKKLRNPSATHTLKKKEKDSWMARIKEGTTLLTAVVALISAILGALVLYGSNKGLFSNLIDDAYSWAYESKEWEGLFNNFPEGYVDMADMDLSPATDLNLVLSSDGNALDGIAVAKNLCTIGVPQDFRLVTGKISLFGKSADMEIYEFIGGRKVVLDKLSVRRKGVILEITPSGKSGEKPIRIAQHPGITADEGMKLFNDFCKEEKEAFFSQLKGRPIKGKRRQPITTRNDSD